MFLVFSFDNLIHKEVKGMKTLYDRIVELLLRFVGSREYLRKSERQRLEMEIQFNSDLSEFREVIQDAEERIKEYESQESCAASLSDIKDTLAEVKDALAEVMETVEGLEMK